jgi:mannose-1-phosphate guanylyltransferase
MCIGVSDLVVVASHDGILVCDKAKSEQIKAYADKLSHRPAELCDLSL